MAFLENLRNSNLLCICNRISKKTEKNRKKNPVFFSFPLGVWKSEFSVGRPFCSGAGEKETQTLKVVWEQKKVEIFFPRRKIKQLTSSAFCRSFSPIRAMFEEKTDVRSSSSPRRDSRSVHNPLGFLTGTRVGWRYERFVRTLNFFGTLYTKFTLL